MRLVRRFFNWLSSNFGGAITLTGHVLIIREDCPHCGERTLCEVSVIHYHYRCLECGRSVHDREGVVGKTPGETLPESLTEEEEKGKRVAA